MRNTVRPRWPILALSLCLGVGSLRAGVGDDNSQNAGQVCISLRSTVGVTRPRITIGDVADIRGGSAYLREKIQRLDLAEIEPSETTTSIPRQQIFFRLEIADLDAKCFHLEGAALVSIQMRRYQVPEEEILAAARQRVLQRLPGTAQDLSIQLAQPLAATPTVEGTKESVKLEAEIPGTMLPLGKVHVDVGILVGGARRTVVPVTLDVKLYERVAVTLRRIEQGEPLTNDNVFFDRRTIDSWNDYVTAETALIGKGARHQLPPGHVMTAADVERLTTEEPVVVKQQTLVKLVAHLGAMQVSALGETLQDGRAGQLIRVRNIDSHNIVIGRVVDRSVVEVDY
jgi:flagella basal body P-ring formation protein FlgA